MVGDSKVSSTLSPIQRELVEVFQGLDGVYLTGVAALGGFYLHHLRSHDLDFFTGDADRIEHLARHLMAWCAQRGFEAREEQRYPGFRRIQVRRDDETTLVDIAHDPVAQTVPSEQKPIVEGVRVDALEDIRANALGALLGRADIKDLVDLYFLAQDGHDPLEQLGPAQERDAGLDPATLAWVLTSMNCDISDLMLVRSVDAESLERFRQELVTRLRDGAFPSS